MSDSIAETATERAVEDETTVGIVGVGTIDEPIAIQIAKRFETAAFDIDDDRITSLADAGITPASGTAELGPYRTWSCCRCPLPTPSKRRCWGRLAS